MNEFVVKNGKELKIGYTTGTCATAAAKSASHALLFGKFQDFVEIEVPAGKKFKIEILEKQLFENKAVCAVRKYSGDDPDVTNGILIFATVEKTDNGIEIDGGQGVGRVTKKGLSCSVGKAAINPVPLKMIEQAISEEIESSCYKNGLKVVISVPQGEEIAKKTFNARLGILGGISILGTSGVVEPMSEDALIETIKIETAQKNRDKILFASPGNYGLDFANNELGLNIDKAVKYSNYLGEFIDYAVYCGFKRVLIVAHVGKLIKVGAAVMNTHSKMADARNEVAVAHSAICGADRESLINLMKAVTTDDMHDTIVKTGLANEIYKSIADKIKFNLDYRTKKEMNIEFVMFSNENGLLAKSENADTYIEEIRGYSDEG